MDMTPLSGCLAQLERAVHTRGMQVRLRLPLEAFLARNTYNFRVRVLCVRLCSPLHNARRVDLLFIS
jgi:hypothetical protein